jgi:glucose/arabinose dehydrogenase
MAHSLRRFLVRLAALALVALPGVGRADDVLPPNFVAEPILKPPNPVIYPTQLAFLPDGRMLIASKGGRLWMAKNGNVRPTPVWDGIQEVNADTDRGLLGIAVDPNFKTNRYIYLLYVADPDSSEFTYEQHVFIRLTRYQMSVVDTDVVDQASRTILIGRTWAEGGVNTRPSHSAGSLRWGRDGSLLVSIGDGAHWTDPLVDSGGNDSLAFLPGRTDPSEDIGSYRSQYLNSLCGKILRINPHTGYGYASNPYADNNLASVRSRVYQYGLRNAYRFVVRPGTGSPDTAAGNPGVLYIGDTGWSTWEDICIADQPGLNFGWPCYEGPNPNTLYLNGTQPSHHGCSTIGTGDNPGPLRGPIISWHHVDSTLSVPTGYVGTICIGGEFYTGYQYPAAYRGRFFYGELGYAWIAAAGVNAQNQLLSVQRFASASPADIEVDPWTGDLYFSAIFEGPNNLGEIRRIRYLGHPANQPPVATIDAPGGALFFASGQNTSLSGSGTDTEDAPGALVYQWKVDRIIDGVIQPDAQVSLGASSQFLSGGGSLPHEVHLIVYDTDGKSDTARVTAFPEIDLEPSPVMAVAVAPGNTELRFWLRNRGRMASSASRWRVWSGPTLVAEGDTLCPGVDSVRVRRPLPPGDPILRVAVDAFDSVIETNESNNEWIDTVQVTPVIAVLPARLSLSEPRPNPAVSGPSFTIEVPEAAPLEWRIFDLNGREVWRQARRLDAGSWSLSWNARDAEGRRAKPGLYFARVTIAGETFVRRFTLMR